MTAKAPNRTDGAKVGDVIEAVDRLDDDNTESRPRSRSRSGSEPATPLRSNTALWGWIVLCFSTGPTSSMTFNYVGACIQATANAVGHVPGSTKACSKRGTVSCVVRFGGHEIDYLSYLLYLRAIGRALEGVVSIFVAGAADYAHFRKPMMMSSIYVFGILALPFAALVAKTYAHLYALSGLYCALTMVQGVYTVVEASYVPIFMRSVGWFGQSAGSGRAGRDGREGQEGRDNTNSPNSPNSPKNAGHDRATWAKGSRVSVLGLVSSNVGGIVALLIGVILVYSRGSYTTSGYSNYLLAVTIGGCLTIVVAAVGHFLLPNVPGREKPEGQSLFLLPFRTWLFLLRSAPRYPQAFKLCIGWILWNTGYSNFLGLLSSLFLEVAGITSGSSIYTVYSFTSVIFACMGSLTWMLVFSATARAKTSSSSSPSSVKLWAYAFLSVNILCVFWGCLGIGKRVAVGYKHVPEFWVAQFLFMSTSSALRAFNRMLFSSFIPAGSEALYFGLEITLDLATGWINPLVQGVIQDHTHNLRYPMLPNLFLMLIALALYVWVDVAQGIEDARTPLVGVAAEAAAE